tara:strand:- start:74 stop:265 length:192 start_codon:yes stop_codon:yes gene_type:complete
MGGLFSNGALGKASDLVSKSTAGKMLSKTPAGQIREDIVGNRKKKKAAKNSDNSTGKSLLGGS